MFARVDRQMLKTVGLLAAAVLAGVVVGMPRPDQSAPMTLDPPVRIAETGLDVIVVHVSGEVVSPGLVRVPADARVADVLAAAGGVTQRADLPGLNLAETVADGQQIVVPTTGRQGMEPSAVVEGETRIRINDADVVALETLPGVGPVLAGTIVAHRNEYGPFRSVEDLLDVPGIGEQKLASLRDRVVVP